MNEPKLPRGARKFKKPTTRKVGGWVELPFDASVVRYGITWLRIVGGFGFERGDNGWERKGASEDWVADLPSSCVSVSQSDWRKPYFGFIVYPSFDDAMKGELARATDHAEQEVEELKTKLNCAAAAFAQLHAAKRLAGSFKSRRSDD